MGPSTLAPRRARRPRRPVATGTGPDAGPRPDLAAPRPDRPRLAEFDALRAAAMLLVVAVHSALAYTRLGLPRLLWGVRQPAGHLGLDLAVWWVMAFSMPLFFTIGGYFAAEVESTRGPWAFLLGRGRRVVLPTLLVAPVLLPTCFAAWAVGWLVSGRCTFLEIRRLRFFDPVIEPNLYGPAHLWFLEYLTPMLLAFGLARAVARWARPRRPAGAEPGPRRTVAALAGWTVATALVLLAGRVTAAVDLALDRHNAVAIDPLRLVYYALFFAAGVWLRGRRGLLDVASRWSGWLLLATLPALAVRAWLLGTDFGGSADPTAVAASSAVLTWLSLAGVLGLFRRHLARPIPLVRRLAEASFGIYLVHFPVVGLIQADLYPVPIPVEAKAAVTLAVTLALGLAADHLVIRRTRLGRFLVGRSSREGQPPAIRATTAPTRRAASSTSASVVVAPRLNRTDERS